MNSNSARSEQERTEVMRSIADLQHAIRALETAVNIEDPDPVVLRRCSVVVAYDAQALGAKMHEFSTAVAVAQRKD